MSVYTEVVTAASGFIAGALYSFLSRFRWSLRAHRRSLMHSRPASAPAANSASKLLGRNLRLRRNGGGGGGGLARVRGAAPGPSLSRRWRDSAVSDTGARSGEG